MCSSSSEEDEEAVDDRPEEEEDEERSSFVTVGAGCRTETEWDEQEGSEVMRQNQEAGSACFT